MRNSESHIIQKQSIEIHFEEMDASIEMQQRVTELFYERMDPAMNSLFDDLVGDERSATIDKLEIDCGNLPGKYWEDELVKQVTRKLADHLRQVDKKPVDKNGKATDAIISFLGNGVLPWNNRFASMEELEELVVMDQSFVDRILNVVQFNSSCRKRLLYQFSRKFKLTLIWKMLAATKANLPELEKTHLQNGESILVSEIDNILSRLIESGKDPVAAGIENLTEKFHQPGDDETAPNSPDDLYINNAGLILLHPFLPVLFDQLDLIKNNQWLDNYSHQKAILVTEYLVRGGPNFPEYDLPLNKILCSYAITEPVDKEMQIDDFLRANCDELLIDVIRQWSRLKNTGIDALRETFLQRIGKLSRTTKGWLLQVEQKPVDVLLGGLPWGIGVIKLPWMKEILYVEWT